MGVKAHTLKNYTGRVCVSDRILSLSPHTLFPQETLTLLLKSLPMGCYFNVYGFGSRYEAFFP